MRVTCSCGQTLEIGDEYAGRTAQCPACQASFTVPMPAAAAAPATPATAAATTAAGAPWPQPAMDSGAQAAQLDRLQKCATASLVCGIATMACYLVMFVILAIIGMEQEKAGGRTPDAPLAASLTVILLGLIAATLSIVSVVLGFRGKKPANTRNRGVGLAGFIVGIVGASLSACCILFFAVMFFIGLSQGLSAGLHK